MNDHYNAFISYRHAPLDVRIASEVQKQLERMRIPKAIQEATGIKRISRIFRDKEELLITSDLNDVIEHALNNSDYLIVICSKSTKESEWVQKEIEFFLKTHSRKRILTVLADGEPYDVIPEILLDQHMEPLSCDYRLPVRRARKEELPRLAAALIGCSYDDLVRRQQRYRQRRMAAALSAAVVTMSGLAGYYAWSAGQIAENYEQALINQSRYLSAESLKLLESGDRVSAMLLALEALPDEETPRPVIAEAQYALSQSAYAYVVPGNERLSAVNSFAQTGAVDAYEVSQGGEYLVVMHSSDNVTVWDTDLFQELWSQSFEETLYDMTVTQENRLLLLTGTKLHCCDLASGELLWTYQGEPYDWFMLEATIEVSGSEAVTVISRWTEEGSYQEVLTLDIQSGEVKKTARIPDCGQAEGISTLGAGCLSPDGMTYAVTCIPPSDGGLYDAQTHVLLYHRDTDEFVLSPEVFYRIDRLGFTQDGDVLAAGTRSHREYSLEYRRTYVSYLFLYEGQNDLIRISAEDGSLLWENSFFYPQRYFGIDMEAFAVTKEQDAEQPAVACCAGNICEIYDADSGELRKRIEFPAPIVRMQAQGHRIRCILENGQLALYAFGTGVLMTSDFLVGDLESALLGDEIYAAQHEASAVLLYRWEQYDEEWHAFEAADPVRSIDHMCSTPDQLLLLVTGQDNQPKLQCMDAAARKLIWEYPLLGNSYQYSMIGLSDDGKFFWLQHTGEDENGNYGKRFLRLECSTGTVSVREEAPPEAERLQSSGVTAEMDDGSVCAVYQNNRIILQDQNGKETARFSCSNRTPLSMQFTEQELLVLYDNDTLCRYDLDGTYLSETEAFYQGMILNQIRWQFQEDGTLVLHAGTDLNLIDTHTWQLYTHVTNCYGFCPQERLVCVPALTQDSQKQPGWFALYTPEQLIQKAQRILRDASLSAAQRTQYGL